MKAFSIVWGCWRSTESHLYPWQAAVFCFNDHS